jgi:hypothetical protein
LVAEFESVLVDGEEIKARPFAWTHG